MNEPKTYTVSAATLDVVTEYLSKQPWAAVNHVFVALNSELRTQIEATQTQQPEGVSE